MRDMVEERAAASGLVPVLAPSPPVARLIVGRPVEEAASLLPRLFSLCRTAQGTAARHALGLAAQPGETEALAREVLRDHLMKLCLSWPGKLNRAARPLPQGWETGTGVAHIVFGAPAPPATGPEFDDFLSGDQGAAPILRAIDQCFAPREACASDLRMPDATALFTRAPCENSVAGRQAAHPVMLHIARTRGRGPIWRAAARLFDIDDALNGRLPRAQAPAPGRAIVAAARGAYALTAASSVGVVTAFDRITPTDHLLAPGGILDQALATLPAARAGLAPLLLDILDPCTPVRLERRERAHA